MAFTFHWPNTFKSSYPRYEVEYQKQVRHELYADRICGLTPLLSVQADVVYPNAEAGMSRGQLEEGGDADTAEPTGCVGHQLDSPFPVESRTPTALPLLMYPSQALDMCALPVLNWEKYIQELHRCVTSSYACFYSSKHVNGTQVDKRQVIMRKRRLKAQEVMNKIKAKRECAEAPLVSDSLLNNGKSGQPKRISIADTRRALLNPEAVRDLEMNEHEKETKKTKRRRPVGRPPREKMKHPKIVPMPILHDHSRRRLSKLVVKRFVNVPSVKVQGTWNYLYNGTGACNWIHDSKSRRAKHLFVGNGTKLRMISLKVSKSSQMLSYCVTDVWEEDQIPTNVNLDAADEDDPLSSQIYQIKTLRRRGLIGVRRGKSIEIYLMTLEGIPSLIASIPNVGYGPCTYAGLTWNIKKPSPLLTSFDLNPHFPSELVTIDENAIIQFIDITLGRTMSQVKGMKSRYVHTAESRGAGAQKLLNDWSGVAYAGDHPQVIFYWSDSTIHFHDARAKSSPLPTRELFNLRSSASSISFSDQEYFRKGEPRLDEYVSAFAPSANPLHYYFATTQRLFLMDIRVPRNPVTKLSHGLVSAPAFMDLIMEDNFEVVVAGSQRSSETFCAFFDRGHVACVERSQCQQRNPVLQSPPRHLSNPREFGDFVLEQSLNAPWESDFQVSKARCDSWTTGLCLMKPSKNPATQSLPSSFILFNGNSFGDVFVQEWDQKPIPATRSVSSSDERLKSFVCQWRSSMEKPFETPLPPPQPARYVNHDLLIDVADQKLKRTETIRPLPFDPFTPHSLVHHRVRKGLPPLIEQINALDPICQSMRAQTFLRHWEPDFGPVVAPAPPSEPLEPFHVAIDTQEESPRKEDVVPYNDNDYVDQIPDDLWDNSQIEPNKPT